MEAKAVVDVFRKIFEESNKETRDFLVGQFDEVKSLITSTKPENQNQELERFNVLETLGEGAYGTVYLVKDTTENGKEYAMKVIKLEDNEIGKNIAREISIMFDISHHNIVRLEHAFSNQNSVYLIMEHIQESLAECIGYGSPADPDVVKRWLKEILSAVAYLHKMSIVHRDLKPSNILVDVSNTLKLADFGSARGWFSDIQLTPEVTTLEYRAPELLLGFENYTPAIDMWSIGCIFAEIADWGNLFSFNDEEDDSNSAMLDKIFKKLGTPTKETWPGVHSLPSFPKNTPLYAEATKISSNLDAAGNDLLLQLLKYDPSKRITAEGALKHHYFQIKG